MKSLRLACRDGALPEAVVLHTESLVRDALASCQPRNVIWRVKRDQHFCVRNGAPKRVMMSSAKGGMLRLTYNHYLLGLPTLSLSHPYSYSIMSQQPAELEEMAGGPIPITALEVGL